MVNNGSVNSSLATVFINVYQPGQLLTANLSSSAGQTVTVSVPPAIGQGGVTATIANATNASQPPVTVTASSHPTNPVAGTFQFGSGSTYVDLEAPTATTNDTITSYFYYPPNTPNPVLLYYNTADDAYEQVYNNDGSLPALNTTSNLDDTTSGGRFTVIFGPTSTPPITALQGTVFALVLTAGPAIQCPANITNNYNPAECGQTVAFATPTATGTPAPGITCQYNGSVIQSPFFFPVGTNVIFCTASNSVGTDTCTFDVIVVDTNPPVAGANSLGTYENVSNSVSVAKMLAHDSSPSQGTLEHHRSRLPNARGRRRQPRRRLHHLHAAVQCRWHGYDYLPFKRWLRHGAGDHHGDCDRHQPAVSKHAVPHRHAGRAHHRL